MYATQKIGIVSASNTGEEVEQVIEGLHTVNVTHCSALLLFQGSWMRAGQWPQSSDVL